MHGKSKFIKCLFVFLCTLLLIEAAKLIRKTIFITCHAMAIIILKLMRNNIQISQFFYNNVLAWNFFLV
jgi:hypothetical protein